MKLAVMQPYFFPYIGYFELMASVDKFVFLTDVQYTRGWINRNRIRSKNKEFQYLTVPIFSHKQETLISDIVIADDWSEDHLKKIQFTYGKKTHPLLDYYATFDFYGNICPLLKDTLMWTAKQLDIECEFCSSEDISENTRGQKIVDICKFYNADCYVNLSGGRELYSQEDFGDILLEFMPPTQYPNKYSIIDVLLTEDCRHWLHSEMPKPVVP